MFAFVILTEYLRYNTKDRVVPLFNVLLDVSKEFKSLFKIDFDVKHIVTQNRTAVEATFLDGVIRQFQNCLQAVKLNTCPYPDTRLHYVDIRWRSPYLYKLIIITLMLSALASYVKRFGVTDYIQPRISKMHEVLVATAPLATFDEYMKRTEAYKLHKQLDKIADKEQRQALTTYISNNIAKLRQDYERVVKIPNFGQLRDLVVVSSILIRFDP
jgi:hypothetical protein